MKITVIFLSVLLIISCSGERVLKKHESGRDFNSTAENRKADVVLENGKTLEAENMQYKRGMFYYGPDRMNSLSHDSVKSVSFYKIHPFGTGLRYTLGTIACGIIIGGVAEAIEGNNEIPAGFIMFSGLGIIVSPLSFLIGYLNGQNITYEMKHRK